MLFRNYLRREALLSSKIEGTRTTLAQLALYELAGTTTSDDAFHVQNYLRAFDYGRVRLKELPVGLRFLDEVHDILMAASNREHTTPGRIRDCTALIGSSNLQEARFVPPPFQFVRELVENLEGYLRDDDEPVLLKLAVGHYQFETIHPYRDGNGRLGRLLISLFLEQQQILTAPMLYISAFFERHQQRYYDLLLGVSTRNAWEAWILFFLEAVATQARDAVERTRRLADLRANFHGRVRQKQRSHAIHDLVDALFTSPVMSVPSAQRILDVTYAAAKPHVMRLIEAEILDPKAATVGKTAFYFAPELIRTLEGPVE